MKLSVLVTYYNQDAYVDQSLAGILLQKTNFDFEILVGDDGSSDDTIDKIQSWREKYPDRIKLFIMDREPGQKYHAIHRASANRLNLLNHASGDYFTVVDGDDYFTDMGKFQMQVDILDDSGNQGCVGCGHDLNAVYEDDGNRVAPLAANELQEGQVEGWMYWATGKYFHAETIIFRNIFLKGRPVNCPGLYFDDEILTLFMLNFGHIYYLPLTMGVYRINSSCTWALRDHNFKLLNIMMLYEAALKANPPLRGATLRRYFFVLREVYKRRKEFVDQEYDFYRRKAAEENAVETLKWLNYGHYNVFEQGLTLMSFYRNRLLKHIYTLRGQKCQAACIRRHITDAK